MADAFGEQLLTELANLRAEADALNARLGAGLGSRVRYAGVDPDGLVRVTVDGQGRASDVVVTPGWRRMVDVQGLQRAAVVAAGAAERQRQEGWAAAATAAGPPPAAAASPGPLAGASSGGSGLDGQAGADLIRALLPVLEMAERQLNDIGPLIREHLTAEVTLNSPNGQIAAGTRGGIVTEIVFRSPWIRDAGAEEIAHQVCRLLQDAHDRTWTGIGDFLPTELTTLMAFAAEPERMLRQLGLGPPRP